jgi:hypothetical protein
VAIRLLEVVVVDVVDGEEGGGEAEEDPILLNQMETDTHRKLPSLTYAKVLSERTGTAGGPEVGSRHGHRLVHQNRTFPPFLA